MIRALKTGYDNLQSWGLVAAFLILSFGSRTFWEI